MNTKEFSWQSRSQEIPGRTIHSIEAQVVFTSSSCPYKSTHNPRRWLGRLYKRLRCERALLIHTDNRIYFSCQVSCGFVRRSSGNMYGIWLLQDLGFLVKAHTGSCRSRSSKTRNLCSKCFADFQKKQPDEDPASSTSNSQSDLFPSETNSDNGNTSIPTPPVTPTQQLQQQLPPDLNVACPSQDECGPRTDTAHILSSPTKRSCDSDSQSEDDASPIKRPRLLDGEDRPDSSRSKQKSRRRCFRCQIKLELVQQELGSCRCGYVFCMLHRLPEQHDCTFDHMGRGREEAIMKMVKLDRKVGRSCQRIGEGCS